jgi:hypothetical protein
MIVDVSCNPGVVYRVLNVTADIDAGIVSGGQTFWRVAMK